MGVLCAGNVGVKKCGGTLCWVIINISMEGHVLGVVMIPIAVLCVCVYSWLETAS